MSLRTILGVEYSHSTMFHFQASLLSLLAAFIYDIYNSRKILPLPISLPPFSYSIRSGLPSIPDLFVASLPLHIFSSHVCSQRRCPHTCAAMRSAVRRVHWILPGSDEDSIRDAVLIYRRQRSDQGGSSTCRYLNHRIEYRRRGRRKRTKEMERACVRARECARR